MRAGVLALAAAGVFALLGAGTRPAPKVEADREALKAKYRRPAEVPHPEDNAPTEARVRLGRMLFFDPASRARA
jgi:cytochrome c peroxidase